MKPEFQQAIEIDQDSTKFIPFRNRKSYWGDRSMRPLIPNVVTVIPPDINPELLNILLYRMKLEENAYKLKNIDSQAINSIWLENKLDHYLFPKEEDAILSKANECNRLEKYTLIKEIDQALPPVLPPPIILSTSAELPAVRQIKTPFSFAASRDEDLHESNQLFEYDYSDENQQSRSQDNEEFDQENKNLDISPIYSSKQTKPISNKQFENPNNNISQYGNPPINTYPPFKQPYDNYNNQNNRPFDPSSSYEDDRRRQQPRDYIEDAYGSPQISQSPTQSQSPISFQESNKTPPPYSNPTYRYPPPNYDNFNSRANAQPLKQPQIQPPPFIPNPYNRKPLPHLPPPPPPPMSSITLPPPPPFLGKDRPPNIGNNNDNRNSGPNSNSQWNRY